MRLKSKLIFLLLFGFGALMSAQENPNEPVAQQPKPLIPSIGTYMVEVNFNPFSSNIISIDNLKGKYFINNSLALRLGVKINSNSNKQTHKDWDEAEIHPSFVNENSFYYGINPGFEYHFLKNSKISPYTGFELSYGRKSSDSKYEYYTQTYNSTTSSYDYIYVSEEVKGGWGTTVSNTYVYNGNVYYNTTKSYGLERAFTSFGANLLFGSDFYFVKNMYFGFELGFGYTYVKNDRITVDISNQVNKLNVPSRGSSSLNINYNNAIRFGVWF